MHELTAGRCPVWLNEGIAVWAEEWRDGERLDWAETALSQQRPFRFAQLAGTFTSLSAGDAELAYAQSYLAVRALVERYGTQGLIDLLKALRTQPLAEAFATALRLNNRYFLDGRDANSFAGVAWCFGRHDRPWAERPIFGTVRYMNAAGLERKFAIDDYVRWTATLAT